MRPSRSNSSLLLLCALCVTSASAQSAPSSTSRGGHMSVQIDGDSIAHVVSRQSAAAASFAITSEDGRSALLLMDTTIVAQLTDRGLSALHQSMDSSAHAADDNMFARMVAGAVLGGLKPMFDHGIAYHLRDLASAQYDDKRLVLRGKSGKEAFGRVSFNDRELMESFSPRDAKEFARRAMIARERLH